MTSKLSPSPKVPTPTTMAEVARLAGVSVATVSKTMNGREDVAPATRAKVRRAMESSGFIRRPLTNRKRAGNIDLVINRLDSFWALEIVKGAEEGARGLGCTLSVISTLNDSDRSKDWISILASRPTDGVVVALTSPGTDDMTQFARTIHAPVVLLDPVGGRRSDWPVVGANNWQGGFIATEYLIQHGHRRIGIIIGPDCYECSLDRRDGYIAALARAAIEVDPELIMAGSFRWEGASEAAERLMSLQTRPTAVFTSSDVGAAALYQVAARRGLRVPDDISVVGFDDVAICTIMAPPLTTIRQPLHEMARAAVRMTEDLSTGVLAKGERHIQLTTTLVERQSVGTLQ